MTDLETIELGLDELEALRLADIERLYHVDAGNRMGVSRATFGRLVETARNKIACALVEGKCIVLAAPDESITLVNSEKADQGTLV